MAKKTFTWFGIIGLFTVAGFYFLSGREEKLLAAPGKPWIEVTSEKVFAVLPDGSTLRELRTGDEIEDGTTLRSDVSGRATVHLPDGSAFRLDANSTFTLELVSLDERGETLTVRATLLSGRVWSKIVNLATPKSSWEVKTSNAVATVRGTAFFTEYKAGKSRIWSSEHEVTVRPIDPTTKRVVEEAVTAVQENALLEITDQNARAVAERPSVAATLLVAAPAPKEILEERWVRENRMFDAEIEAKAQILKEETGDEKRARLELIEETKVRKEKAKKLREERYTNLEIRDELKKENLEAFRERVRERITIEEKSTEGEDILNEERRKEEVEIAPEAGDIPAPTRPPSTNTSPTPVVSGKPVSLLIETKTVSRVFAHGNRVSFTAVLVFSDGRRVDVTTRTNWKLSGNVGSLESPGVLVAKIREEDSEIGDIKGSIQASIEYEGASFTAPPLDFMVTPVIDDTVPLG